MMDLSLGHYPRPRSIVDFKLDALDGQSLSLSWFKTKQMTATERDLPIATNWHSLLVQPRWFRCVWWGNNMTIFTWKGQKIASTNDVGNDGIVNGLLAITKTNCKTMRIQSGSSGGKFEILFWSWFPAMQENSVDPENPEVVANENFTENSCSWTDQNTYIIFYERPISHFHIQ